MNYINIFHYDSPAGELILGSFQNRLCLCDWAVEKRRERTDTKIQRLCNATYRESTDAIIEKTLEELHEYFDGKRTTFDIPLLFIGTDFQKEVWNELLKIPYGKTISYGEQAKRMGRPNSFRAVASANGANPISIFVPCHRVIGSNKKLTGYGGGLKAKEILLDLERRKVCGEGNLLF